MYRKIVVIGLVLLFSLCFSSVAMAEYQENPGADKILVNKEKNEITFLYDETDEALMTQWEALPSYSDVSSDAWYR